MRKPEELCSIVTAWNETHPNRKDQPTLYFVIDRLLQNIVDALDFEVFEDNAQILKFRCMNFPLIGELELKKETNNLFLLLDLNPYSLVIDGEKRSKEYTITAFKDDYRQRVAEFIFLHYDELKTQLNNLYASYSKLTIGSLYTKEIDTQFVLHFNYSYNKYECFLNIIHYAESLEVEISKEHIEQFFDVLRKNKYNSDRLYLNTVFKKYGNTRDALAINVPTESGCGTSPSEWIDCKFCDGDSQHFQEVSSAANTSIELGMYNEKSLYWAKIGQLLGSDLYLCDSIIEIRRFDEASNIYSQSEIRQFLKSFYEESFLPYSEKGKIISHPLLKDFIFLLSEDEYLKYDLNIKSIEKSWWLRSQGKCAGYTKIVNYDGSVGSGGLYVANDTVGVRPAIILKKDRV